MTMIDEVDSGAAQLLDVRTPEEWEGGHDAHAFHIPVDKLIGGELGPLSSDKKIYVYCRGGVRAGSATEYLKSRGFQAENLGGLGDLLLAGGALVKS